MNINSRIRLYYFILIIWQDIFECVSSLLLIKSNFAYIKLLKELLIHRNLRNWSTTQVFNC